MFHWVSDHGLVKSRKITSNRRMANTNTQRKRLPGWMHKKVQTAQRILPAMLKLTKRSSRLPHPTLEGAHERRLPLVACEACMHYAHGQELDCGGIAARLEQVWAKEQRRPQAEGYVPP